MKWISFSVILLAIFFSESALSQTCGSNICVSYTSARKPQTSYFNWTIKVQARSPESQRNIDSVIYNLPRSFNPRVVRLRKQTNNPSYTFNLTKSGYGDFIVIVKVYLHNKAPVTIEHPVKLR